MKYYLHHSFKMPSFITVGTWIYKIGVCECTTGMQCCGWTSKNTCVWSH